MPDGTQKSCTCTGAESFDCSAYCPFAGAYDDDGMVDDDG